jgi:hypothetical protein
LRSSRRCSDAKPSRQSMPERRAAMDEDDMAVLDEISGLDDE